MDGMPLEMAHSRQSSFVARIPGPKDFRPGWVLPFVSRKSPESDCNPSWDRRLQWPTLDNLHMSHDSPAGRLWGRAGFCLLSAEKAPSLIATPHGIAAF